MSGRRQFPYVIPLTFSEPRTVFWSNPGSRVCTSSPAISGVRGTYAQLENATFGGLSLAMLKLFVEPLKNTDNRGILTRLKRASGNRDTRTTKTKGLLQLRQCRICPSSQSFLS